VFSDEREKIENERCRVAFLGHSSALVSMNGLNIITDPHMGSHVFFFIRRKNRIPLRVRDLPPIDLILVSHGHYDHLDLPTIRKLPRKTPAVAPAGLATVLTWGARKHVITLHKWESHRLGDVTVTAVPAAHFLGRPPFFPISRFQGYVIEGDATVYFAGDTGLFKGLSEIGRKWDIDVALLPIGAYSPRSFRRHHMSPEDAIEAGRMLRAKSIVPIHWGAFKLSLEPMNEPIPRLERAARKAGDASIVKILEPGEALSIGRGKSVEILNGL
jgi:L-ascorbate metabolism protein UlaG (beta-lactamase superfamily)